MKGRLSPALVISLIALFVALGGTAGAVVTAAVPLAKRALVADNAKKVGGLTSQQVIARASGAPGPASSAAGLMSVKSSATTIAAGAATAFTISCDAGQKVMGGGFASDGPVFNFDSYPQSDTTWNLFLANADEAAGHPVTLYATCIR